MFKMFKNLFTRKSKSSIATIAKRLTEADIELLDKQLREQNRSYTVEDIALYNVGSLAKKGLCVIALTIPKQTKWI